MLSISILKRFEGFTLDLALEAPEEQIIVLFGVSGSGKSLTLAALAGLTTPDAGRISIGERVLFDSTQGINLPAQARQIGMVRQDLALFPHMRAADNIAYGLNHTTRAERSRRVKELLELMQLEGLGGRKPAELSGGQQQRVALARALAREPSLMLLDEPFSALDVAVRVELRRDLKRLQQRLHTSMFFVTHDLGEAALLADRMAVIADGRILQFDTVNRVLRAPANARVARVVGVKNILPATVLSPTRVRIGERELDMHPTELPVGAQVQACIRSERVLLVRPDSFNHDHPNPIAGALVHEESDGNNVMLYFRADGARLQPSDDFDLYIDLPVYVYERLQLARERRWVVTLKPNVLNLVPE